MYGTDERFWPTLPPTRGPAGGIPVVSTARRRVRHSLMKRIRIRVGIRFSVRIFRTKLGRNPQN